MNTIKNGTKMLRLSDCSILAHRHELACLPTGKLLINTINAHSYNVAQKDDLFARALRCGDVLIPDGKSIVVFDRWLWGKKLQRIAGADLFDYEMASLNRKRGKCFFMGSSPKVLRLIERRCARLYPHIVVESYSPPFKSEFSDDDNRAIVKAINEADPDLLWIGMTAPKQEKWVYSHWDELDIHCHCGTIGAVFDFCAGTKKRAPRWWQNVGMEWLYRLLNEPHRLWRRYLIGNVEFVYRILCERMTTA